MRIPRMVPWFSSVTGDWLLRSGQRRFGQGPAEGEVGEAGSRRGGDGGRRRAGPAADALEAASDAGGVGRVELLEGVTDYPGSVAVGGGGGEGGLGLEGGGRRREVNEGHRAVGPRERLLDVRRGVT